MKEMPEDLLRRYGISAAYGFLPETLPLERLPDPYYEPWELVVSKLPRLLSADDARTTIDNMPILGTNRLCDVPQWQRAYVVLGFLTHAYIWGGEEPSKVYTSTPSPPPFANTMSTATSTTDYPAIPEGL